MSNQKKQKEDVLLVSCATFFWFARVSVNCATLFTARETNCESRNKFCAAVHLSAVPLVHCMSPTWWLRKNELKADEHKCRDHEQSTENQRGVQIGWKAKRSAIEIKFGLPRSSQEIAFRHQKTIESMC